MDPNATSILDLLASFTALQSAGSQLCLSGPGCCGAKPLHMLLHTSPSILPTPQNLHISASAVLLSICTMQMDADWLLLFNSGWICFYGWACPWGTVVPFLWGRQALGPPRAAAASHKQRSAGFIFSRLEHMCQDIMMITSSDFF